MGSTICIERNNDCESSYYDFIPKQKKEEIIIKFYASDTYVKKRKHRKRKRKRPKINML